MERRELPINKGQYLQEILPQIPSNTILDKTICGCGATTLELNTSRHSIIIEPNLPVIMGKMEKHSFMLGVIAGVGVGEIVKYLNDNAGDGYYKIMTTPESYPKVAAAIRRVGMDLYEDFFLLFDECERTTQDIDYRSSIILPIDDFFKCKAKAMVSATPYEFLDPRFEEQEFVRLKIMPTYDYRQKITVCVTNNVFNEFFTVLNSEKYKDKKFCIFINSTEKTMKLVDELNIEGETNVYCSEKSVKKLRSKGYLRSYSNLKEEGEEINLNKYNFFTSRFYSAVDIELPYKPIVIILTEQFGAKYSIIDPLTETVQIAGRFRNGLSDFMHITNYNRKRQIQDREKLTKFMHECHEAYNKHLFITAVMANNIGEMTVLNQAKERVDFSAFVLPNGKINYFRWSNLFRDLDVVESYIRPSYIFRAYKEVEALDPEVKGKYYAVEDLDRIVLNANNRIKQNNLNYKVLTQMKKLLRSRREGDKIYLSQLKQAYEIVFEGYKELGFEIMEELAKRNKLVKSHIEKIIGNFKLLKKMKSVQVRNDVYRAFKENSDYSTADLNDGLQEIFDKHDIQYNKSGCSNMIKFFFDAEPYRNSDERGWKLASKRIF